MREDFSEERILIILYSTCKYTIVTWQVFRFCVYQKCAHYNTVIVCMCSVLISFACLCVLGGEFCICGLSKVSLGRVFVWCEFFLTWTRTEDVVCHTYCKAPLTQIVTVDLRQNLAWIDLMYCRSTALLPDSLAEGLSDCLSDYLTDCQPNWRSLIYYFSPWAFLSSQPE